MQLIDQNSALIAQETALIPDSSLIDGRTEIDRLSFLTEFASVINFYDHENAIQGNWVPFLLKDPAILLAHISKTNIEEINSLFQHTCTQIEHVADENKIPKELVIGMNNLFDQLIKIFVRIERWTYYMQLNSVEYELKNYVIHQVKHTYSPYFYAILSLRDKLSAINYRQRIKPVHYYLYDKFDQLTWKEQKDKSPYWEILGLGSAINNDSKPKPTSKAVFNALRNTGREVILFLEAIVSFAIKEYPVVKALKGKYPDTLLLRTFVALLGNYTTQLNEISNQHLQFYYQDVLKQNLMEPIADQVLVFADLAKKDSTFTLPVGTVLNGGFDAQKKPILFETIKEVSLNPAKITSIYTIGKYNDTNNLTPIQQIVSPGVIQKDENGKVKSFDFFGNTTAPVSPVMDPVTFGFMLSSPLLFLKEGARTITLELVGLTQTPIDISSLKFYLSTATAWFLIDPIKLQTNANQIIINLTPGDPEIVAFLKNPKQLDITWPALKIEFNTINSLTGLLSQHSYQILTVCVNGARATQLYNDFGAINSKNPYQPFGPTPLINSNFIIGSNEIFSKPITSLQMEIDWINLPKDFSNYYEIYNYYLWGWLVYITRLVRFFRGKPKQDTSVESYNNDSFTADFTLLQESTWKSFKMVPDQQRVAVSTVNKIAAGNKLPSQLLFQETSTNVLDVKSNFCSLPVTSQDTDLANLIDGDPEIQNSPQFKYTESSTSGFMKMSLDGISYGFGSELYSKVVSQLALYNSWMLYHKKWISQLMPAANLPFAPKISQVSFIYSAHAVLNDQSSYPFQCYTYSAFGNKVFTYKQEPLGNFKSSDGELPIQTNDLLFSAAHSGFLFLEIESLVPSESISIYFELTIDQNTLNNSKRNVSYFYLNEHGWSSLPIMADETANFSCSGIITLAVPTTISLQRFMGEEAKYWICIAADNSSSSFPGIVLLKVNGLMAKRFSGGESIVELPAGTISKTQTSVPQITGISQPFPSFGGRLVENQLQMNQRVSLRLKTKDRTITSSNYYQLIKKNFSNVFYAKTIFDKKNRVNKVFVVPTAQNWQDPNATIPLLNQGILDEIKDFLVARTSGLIPVGVTNFDLNPLQITAKLTIMTGYTLSGVAQNVNQALILFLSPWIAGSQPKITIDQDLSLIDVATFIQNIPGVISVNNLSWPIIREGDSVLIVSAAHHSLTCNY